MNAALGAEQTALDLAPHSLLLGLVGLGKIARDQHLPALAASDSFVLAGIASRNATLPDVPSFATIAAMIAALPLDAVSLCTPPQGRFAIARTALEAGLHVMLEKPPGVTVAEVEALEALARDKGVTLFASWHSRHAPGVEPARLWLQDKRIAHICIAWKEDIRAWHPGQDWILDTDGPGVFDPGINALSILTRLLPQPVICDSSTLAIPANRAAPIYAALTMHSGATGIEAIFDFLQAGQQTWTIRCQTDAGDLELRDGGHVLEINGTTQQIGDGAEYPGLYKRFATLCRTGRCDVDLAPLRLVEAALKGSRTHAPAFHWSHD